MVTFKFKILGFHFCAARLKWLQVGAGKMEFVRDKIYCRFEEFYNIMNGIKLVLFVYNFPRICL